MLDQNKNKDIKVSNELSIVDKLKTNHESPEIKEEKPKEKVKEVIVYRDRRGGGGCRVACCGIFLILFLCCASIIALITIRPPFFWDRATEVLNSNLNLPVYETPKLKPEIEEELLREVTPGENIIKLSEEDLTFIARENISQLHDLRLDIEDGVLRAYFALDNTEKPVYMLIDFVIENNKVVVDRIGTASIELPQSLYPLINDTLNTLINNLFDPSGDSEQGGIQNLIFNQSQGLSIKEISFEKDYLVLNVYLDINLF